jgi:hypothetical protein
LSYEHFKQAFNKAESNRPVLFDGRYYAIIHSYDKGSKKYSDTVCKGLTPLKSL